MGADKRGLSKINLILIICVIIILIGLGILIYSITSKDSGSEGTSNKNLGEISEVAEQCVDACSSGQKVSFCDVQRTLPNGNKNSCENLASQGLYDVEACPSISCAPEELDQTCEGLGGEWKEPTDTGACPSVNGLRSFKLGPSDTPLVDGQICCG